jgi:hypothetical protein
MIDKINYDLKYPLVYSKRIGKNLLLYFLLSALLVILIYNKDSAFALGLGSLFFLISLFRTRRANRYYINKITLNQDIYTISYLDIEKNLEISGLPSGFKIEQRHTFATNPTTYLAFYYNEKLIIRQYPIGEWTEDKFDEIMLFHTGKPNTGIFHKIKKAFD